MTLTSRRTRIFLCRLQCLTFIIVGALTISSAAHAVKKKPCAVPAAAGRAASAGPGLLIPWHQPEPVAERHGTCGPTALANLLLYYGKEVDPATIEPEIRQFIGTSPISHADYVKKHYANLPVFKGTLADDAAAALQFLVDRTDAKKPTIIGLSWETDAANLSSCTAAGHYVLVVKTRVENGKRQFLIANWGEHQWASWDENWNWTYSDNSTTTYPPLKDMWKWGWYGRYPHVGMTAASTLYPQPRAGDSPAVPPGANVLTASNSYEQPDSYDCPIEPADLCVFDGSMALEPSDNRECVPCSCGQVGEPCCPSPPGSCSIGLQLDCSGTCTCVSDSDADGICSDVDNCPETYNPDQQDSDGDDIGDVCDPAPYHVPAVSLALCLALASSLLACGVLVLRRGVSR